MPLLQMSEIKKAYPGVLALNDVNFSVKSGEVHALLGKNGAGKSTLIQIISGIVSADGGEVKYEGKDWPITNLHSLPVATVFQENSTFENLTIADNIFGGEGSISALGFVDRNWRYEKSKPLLERFKIAAEPWDPLSNLSAPERKVIEIIRAVSRDSKILILDEPTASLTLSETDTLFELLRNAAATGLAIIYISHRLEEIFRIADRLTVLRDGAKVITSNLDGLDVKKITDLMGGDEAANTDYESQVLPAKTSADGPLRLRVENLTHSHGKFIDINLNVGAGEIVGIGGLVGAGKTELAKAIFGAERSTAGSISIDGKLTPIRRPADAIKNGVFYVTEDRKRDGMFLGMTINANIMGPSLPDVSSKFGFVNEGMLAELAEDSIQKFGVKVVSGDTLAGVLSGGNQQKVLVARWLRLQPRILIVDEPTIGVDLLARAEIYNILRMIRDAGTAVIFISSDLDELMMIADRIVIMKSGKVAGEYITRETSAESLLIAATKGEMVA